MRRHGIRWRVAARETCRGMSVAATAAVAVLAVTGFGASSAAAVPWAGVAEIVTPSDGPAGSGRPLTGGSDGTPFTLALPDGAACSGDSADGGYRVQSFMVRADVDLASLTFGAQGPQPRGVGVDLRQPLFAVNTTSFANAPTNLADRPGGPGAIINVPSFDLGALEGADLPPGAYAIGIACTKGPPSPTQLDRFWSASFEVSGAPAAGGQRSWTAAARAPERSASDVVQQHAEKIVNHDGARVMTETPPPALPEPDRAELAKSGDKPQAAVEATVVSSSASRDRSEFGGPPTFALPAAEIASHLSIQGHGTMSVLLWLAVALIFGRMTMLLARTPDVTAAHVR